MSVRASGTGSVAPVTETGATRMRKPYHFLAAASAVLALAACTDSGLPTGPEAVIAVRTSPPVAAHCILMNANGAVDIYATPQLVDVPRARGPLDVTCDDARGWHGHVRVGSAISPEGVATAVASGAIVAAAVAPFAPAAGAGVLAAAAVGGAASAEGSELFDGRAYAYPKAITVPMEQTVADLPEAKAYPAAPPPAVQPPPRRAPHRAAVRHPAPPCQCKAGQSHS